MSSPLPRRGTPKSLDTDAKPRVVRFEAGESAAIFDALSSSVARALLSCLLDEPTTKSSLADSVGTSLQNVSYHVDKLQSAGLVEIVDEWYSEKGRKMDVYAAIHDPIMLVTSERSDQPRDAVLETAASQKSSVARE